MTGCMFGMVGAAGSTDLLSLGRVLWLKGNASWNVSGADVTGAIDLSGYAQNFTTDMGFLPLANLDDIDGV